MDESEKGKQSPVPPQKNTKAKPYGFKSIA